MHLLTLHCMAQRERSAGQLLIHGKIVSDFKESRARQNQQGLIICYQVVVSDSLGGYELMGHSVRKRIKFSLKSEDTD